MPRTTKLWFVAALAGMAIASLMPGEFRADAWLFGVVLGIGQSLIGLHFYRIALSRTSPAFGPALASGVIRVLVLLIAFAAAVSAGRPAVPFAWSMLVVYAAMLSAETICVARMTEAR